MASKTSPALQHWCLVETDFGTCGLAWTKAGISRFLLPESETEITERLIRHTGTSTPSEPQDAALEALPLLHAYFGGTPTAFDELPLDLTGISSAYNQIYRHTRALRWGELATYGEIAAEADLPGASQLVGQAMGDNPIPVIIPCHRVVAASGKIGGFSAPGGNRTKAKLLNMEQARLRDAGLGQMSLL